MKRILFMIARFFYVAPVWFYKISQYGKREEYSDEKRYSYLRNVVKKVNHGGRIKVNVHGLEKLPQDCGYIIFANHQGTYDGLAMIESHERPLRIVLKKEVSNILLVKQVIRLLHSKIMDRSDIRQSMAVIKEMSKEVQEGKNYLIFPEGTRSMGNELNEFQAGAFKSAVYAKCPIVPVALIDCYKPFDIPNIKKVDVQVHYLDPIYYDEYQDRKTSEIAQLVQSRIQSTLTKYSGKE